jgi:predicted nucleic acid-binding protein
VSPYRCDDIRKTRKRAANHNGIGSGPVIEFSVRYLLEVNVLVAWGWEDHVDHEATVRWIAATKRQRGNQLLTSAIPQLGFVRISVQRTRGLVTIAEASETLKGMLASLGPRHSFLPDDQASLTFPAWCDSASRTTDAHLFQLAQAHQAKFATLDAGIPGAFLISMP